MSDTHHYTPYRPKWHRTRKPIFWWVKRWMDIRFIFRELTCLAVAYFSGVLILLYQAVSTGPEHYAAFIQALTRPLLLLIHVVAFLALVYHSITWFQAAPRAIVVRLGSFRSNDALIAGGNFAAWLSISAAIYYLYLLG